MTAAHTWLRLRRWWLRACWCARLRQLDGLQAQLEREVAETHDVLAVLRLERVMLRNRLARTRRGPALTAQQE